MTSNVGMPNGMPPPVTQTRPTASTDRAEQKAAEGQSVQALNEPEAAEKDDESLQTVVSDLNQMVRELQRELQFSVDEDSGDTVVKVIDKETDEVVRQIPSEQVMRLRKRLEEAAGVIFHDSA